MTDLVILPCKLVFKRRMCDATAARALLSQTPLETHATGVARATGAEGAHPYVDTYRLTRA